MQSGYASIKNSVTDDINYFPTKPRRLSSSTVSSYRRPAQHSRTSTITSLPPVQRVPPTIQHKYGDHQSVRLVKNVRDFVNTWGATHTSAPREPFAGTPRLPKTPRASLSRMTFDSKSASLASIPEKTRTSTESTITATGKDRKYSKTNHRSVQTEHVSHSRKSSIGSTKSSVVSTKSSVAKHHKAPSVASSRRSTIKSAATESIVSSSEIDTVNMVSVSQMRHKFEAVGPTKLPIYAMSPKSFVH